MIWHFSINYYIDNFSQPEERAGKRIFIGNCPPPHIDIECTDITNSHLQGSTMYYYVFILYNDYVSLYSEHRMTSPEMLIPTDHLQCMKVICGCKGLPTIKNNALSASKDDLW